MNRRAVLIGAGSAALLGGVATVLVAAGNGSMADYDAAAARLRARIGREPDLKTLIRYATLAANNHNAQPWRFSVHDRSIGILPDPARRTPAVDPDDHHLFVSLGCAAENLAIAAQASGRPGELVIDNGNDDDSGGGVRYEFGPGALRQSPLLAAIPRRQSTRAVYDGRPVAAADLARLADAGTVPGVSLVLLTDRARIGQARDLVIAGNTAQMADPAFMRELKQWLRFNPRSALATRDGLFSVASGNPVLPSWLGGPALDLFFTTDAENDKYARHIASSAGLAIFLGDRADPAHWIKVGQACQRFALTATSLGLRHAFVNQPVEVTKLRPELARLAGEPDKRPDIVMRFGYGPTMAYALRRPAEAVMA